MVFFACITIILSFQILLSESTYAQWISVKIQNKANGHTLKVSNGFLKWGKWYGGSKDEEVDAPSGEINYDSSKTINSCGRSDASSGTEGYFDIYDEKSNHIAHVTWDCPWGSKQNSYQVETKSDRYTIDTDVSNLYGGAIGSRTIKISNNYGNENVMEDFTAAKEKEIREKLEKEYKEKRKAVDL